MNPEQRLVALQAEYFHLQKTADEFDSKAITIKAWSTTFSLVVLVGAYTSHSSQVLLIASMASLLFWILEVLWKTFQLGYYHRIEAIETHFLSGKDIPPFQIYASWMEKWNGTSWSEVFRMAWWPHVALPHAIVVVAGIALYALSAAGIVRV